MRIHLLTLAMRRRRRHGRYLFSHNCLSADWRRRRVAPRRRGPAAGRGGEAGRACAGAGTPVALRKLNSIFVIGFFSFYCSLVMFLGCFVEFVNGCLIMPARDLENRLA